MTCNICGMNEATIHLTEIVNDQMVEIHLCENCAQEKGTDFKTHFNFGDLLAGFSGGEAGTPSEVKQQVLKCRECGTSYDEFGKTGRLGCPSCYSSFSKLLLPLIRRVQRSTHHIGKKPSRMSDDDRTTYDLRLLQDRLRKSVENEAFEEAAHLRDEIRKIEEKIEKTKKGKKA